MFAQLYSKDNPIHIITFMKTFNRFLSRSTDPDVTKTNAVFTVLALIWLAYFIAFTVALVGPAVLSKILPSDAAEFTKNYVSLIILFITTALFALFSWDMVNDKVRSAIRADVAVKESENSEREYFKRQDLEFKSVTGADLYSISPSSDKALDQSFRSRMARDSIIGGLAYDDTLLRKIANGATKEALSAHIPGVRANKDETITIFRQDIFIYLKSWLMHSVMNGRCMDISVVKQRCPGKKAQYVKALTYIRETSIKQRQVVEKLDSQYKYHSIQMLEKYLDILIDFLR